MGLSFKYRAALKAARLVTVVSATAAFASAGGSALATTCSSVAACVLGQNTGAGFGLEGTAKSNDGVVGITNFVAASSATAKSGVYGQDATTSASSKFNFGVFGTSTSGTGVGGNSSSGFGILGTSSASYGVEGTSAKNTGIVGKTTLNALNYTGAAGIAGYDQSTNKNTVNSGVFGSSPAGTGVRGNSTSGAGVSGSSTSGSGVVGTTSADVKTANNVAGVIGNTYSGVGVAGNSVLGDAVSGAVNAGYDYGTGAAFHAYAYGNSFPPNPNLFIGSSDVFGGFTDVVSIDTYGNMILAGSLTQSGTPLVRTGVARGKAVASFGERTSTPTIDDMGEGQLTGGYAYVRLEANFANTIDGNSKYLVFITPQGNSRGLYVDHITSSGFEVHENEAGRSSLAFDYRIMAKPLDAKPMRLPLMSAFRELGPTVRAPHRHG